MSKSERQQQSPVTRHDAALDVTRRSVLAGAAAVTIGATTTPTITLGANPELAEDMILFVLLSAALTGISEAKLAPGFGPKERMQANESQRFMRGLQLSDFAKLNVGSDPINVKLDYFKWVNERHPAAFEELLLITKNSLNPPDRTRAQAIIAKIQAATPPQDAPKYLARSVVLMWYLGAWYDPNVLKTLSTVADPDIVKSEIISPKAYTQGWIWRIAQAHPMGYSDMQFGYWGQAPKLDLDEFIGRAT